MQASSSLQNFGIVCDIDGVLIKDGLPIKGAKEAVESWQSNPRAQLLFVTNSGGITEKHKAKKTNEQIHISNEKSITENQMIVAHTPMKGLVASFNQAKKRVLYVAREEKEMEKMLRENYGFKHVVSFSEFANDHAYLLPYTHKNHPNFLASQNTDNDRPIHAIFLLDAPVMWDDTLQVLCDLLMSDGRVGHLVDKQQVELFIANPDFVYAGNYKLPRLTQGAFRECLCHLYKKLTDRHLKFTEYGKPYKVTYDYAKELIKDKNCRTVYGIGDNPDSDIMGANNAGPNFFSILVRTGVFQGEGNSETHPAKYVCHSIAEAYKFIEERERQHIISHL
jgi:HAD superfamily hydrolase (TIGR01456 family)